MLERSGTVARLHRGPRYSFNDAELRRGQELAQHLEVVVAGSADLESSYHIDADYRPARRAPQLALSGEQHIPGLVLLKAD